MNAELADYAKRPKRYDNIDGTGEIFMGLMLLAFALIGLLQPMLPEHSAWKTNGFLGLLFMYAILIPMLGLGFLVQRIVKRRITWPRTGYVAFLRDGNDLPAGVVAGAPRWSRLTQMAALALVPGVIAAVLAVLIVIAGRYDIATLPRIVYLSIMATAYGFWVYQMGGGRPWKWFLVLLMALGLLAIGLLVPGDLSAMLPPASWFVAAVWLASGCVTLAGYIRRTQLPAEESE